MLATSDKHFLAVDWLAFDGFEADCVRVRAKNRDSLIFFDKARTEAVQALKSLWH
jgi:hypothetical protein